MREQEKHRWQESTKEERSMGVLFVQNVLDLLGLGSAVTEEILDLVVKELYDYKGYHVRNIPDDEIARVEYFHEQNKVSKEREARIKGILQELSDLLRIEDVEEEFPF